MKRILLKPELELKKERIHNMRHLGHVIWTTPYEEEQQRATAALKAYWAEHPSSDADPYDGLAYMANGNIGRFYRNGQTYSIKYPGGSFEHTYKSVVEDRTERVYYVDLVFSQTENEPLGIWAYVFVVPEDGVWMDTEGEA
ncbi:MAG: hypothetical protein NC548_05505 [Lachnospiraceae bacterium]|nr:hypothetical protein [Lachnospiraceae bacterium]